MLVLTRKAKESIRIGEEILITVVEVRGDEVRIGIEAPLSVPVVRSELVRHGEEFRKGEELKAQAAKD